MDPSTRTNPRPLSPAELWYQLEQRFAEIDVMMKDLRTSMSITSAATPSTGTGSRTLDGSSRPTSIDQVETRGRELKEHQRVRMRSSEPARSKWEGEVIILLERIRVIVLRFPPHLTRRITASSKYGDHQRYIDRVAAGEILDNHIRRVVLGYQRSRACLEVALLV